MFEMYRRLFRRRTQQRLRLLLSLFSLVLVAGITNAQQNVTLDDTDIYIFYSPAASWHASTVPCDSCLSPLNSTAHGGTWHDGTHVVPTVDEDDEGTVGDTEGDGTTTSSVKTSSAPQTNASATSSLSAKMAQTSKTDDDGDSKKREFGDEDGKRRLRGRKRNWTRRPPGTQKLAMERDEGDPFEVQDIDSDESGFKDVPVTATLNFSGTAIYLFAIVPLFPAPPNTTPTFTNLSFALDGTAQGQFLHQPDATQAGTPTVNSSTAEKYLYNVNTFSASGLDDAAHSLVVNVGVDSVLLFDYVVYTAGSSNSTSSGSVTTTAPGVQLTESSNAEDGSSREHNVATFVGAVGGSVGLLSILALGLCISIRYRRLRARQREQRNHESFAENFTARDHGDDMPDEDYEEDGTFWRGTRMSARPAMLQAFPPPFVPRYFPGSTPASPPPYVAEDVPAPVPDPIPLVVSLNRAGQPVTVPTAPPAVITIPTHTLGLQRTVSGSYSYADRPPPTPPNEDLRISLFGMDNVREERNLIGGTVGPLPVDSPSTEESDPMLGLDFDGDTDWNNEEAPMRHLRHSISEAMTSNVPGASTGVHSYSSGSSTPSGTGTSITYMSHITSVQSTSVALATPASMPKHENHLLPPGLYPRLNTSTSLPTLSSSRSPSFESPSQPDLSPKPDSAGGKAMIAYPLFRPPRVPLPPSIYGSDIASQETLEKQDSRT